MPKEKIYFKEREKRGTSARYGCHGLGCSVGWGVNEGGVGIRRSNYGTSQDAHRCGSSNDTSLS